MTVQKLSNQQDIWNKSTKTIPLNRDPSTYAIEKEKLFPRESVICDIGGGTGAESIYFLQKGHSVILLDISNVGLDRAKKRSKEMGFSAKLTTIQKDLSDGDLPIESECCDIVYSRLALHYFSKERTAELLKEIYRILKNGGAAYITVKSPEDKNEIQFLKNTAKKVDDEVFNDMGQIKARFSKSTITGILKRSNISNFEINNYVEVLSGRIDRVKSGADRLILTEIIINK